MITWVLVYILIGMAIGQTCIYFKEKKDGPQLEREKTVVWLVVTLTWIVILPTAIYITIKNKE